MNHFWGKVKGILLQKDSLVICILTGILLLVIVWPVNSEKKEEGYLTDRKDGKVNYQENTKESEEGIRKTEEEDPGINGQITDLEEKTEELLNCMEGVGAVKVMITIASMGEKILEKDIPLRKSVIVETDSQGGTRSTNEEDRQEATVYTTDQDGNKIPYVITETLPSIKGVTVVCQGGDSVTVQKNITEVIQALFGIDAHKIKIVKMKEIT